MSHASRLHFLAPKKNVLMLLLLFAMLSMPFGSRGVSTEYKADIIEVTKEIILRTAEVGLEEAGTRLLGATAWRFLKQAATPVFNRIKQKYPGLFLQENRGSTATRKDAQDAVKMLTDSNELQSMLLEGFNNLDKGQQEILMEIRSLKASLENANSAIEDLSKLNQESFSRILSELEMLRNQRNSNLEFAFAAFTSWPIIFNETYDNNVRGWNVGNFPTDSTPKFDIQLQNGLYHWDVEYIGNWQRYVIAPAGTFVDFTVGFDVKVTDYTPEAAYSLIFCSTENQRYSFTVSTNGMYNLSKISGPDLAKTMIIDWSPIGANFSPLSWNSIKVVVNDQRIQLFLNSQLVGEYRDADMTGGKVGLGIDIFQTGKAVADFDNFELRRKP